MDDQEESIPAECQPAVRKYRRQLKKARQVLFSLSQRVDFRKIPATLKEAVNRQRKAAQQETDDRHNQTHESNPTSTLAGEYSE